MHNVTLGTKVMYMSCAMVVAISRHKNLRQIAKTLENTGKNETTQIMMTY